MAGSPNRHFGPTVRDTLGIHPVKSNDQDVGRLFPDLYPDLATHVMRHLEGAGHMDGGDFEFALDLILDGVERIMDRA